MGEPFTVECRATLAEGGAWLIQARLRFSGGHLNADRELLAEARAALLRAIADAGMEGRARGATSIRIFMDAGDGRITEFEPQGMRDHLRPQ